MHSSSRHTDLIVCMFVCVHSCTNCACVQSWIYFLQNGLLNTQTRYTLLSIVSIKVKQCTISCKNILINFDLFLIKEPPKTQWVNGQVMHWEGSAFQYLVTDDDDRLRKLLSEYLEKHKFLVLSTSSFVEMRHLLDFIFAMICWY